MGKLGPFAQDLTELKSRCWLGLGSHLKAGGLFDAHSGYCQDSLPCSWRTEAPLSCGLVSRGCSQLLETALRCSYMATSVSPFISPVS